MKTFTLETPNFDAILRAAETGETLRLGGRSAKGEKVSIVTTISKKETGDGEVVFAISPAQGEDKFTSGHFSFSDRFCIE